MSWRGEAIRVHHVGSESEEDSSDGVPYQEQEQWEAGFGVFRLGVEVVSYLVRGCVGDEFPDGGVQEVGQHRRVRQGFLDVDPVEHGEAKFWPRLASLGLVPVELL